MIPLEQSFSRGADLFGLLQLAGRDSSLELLQRLTRPLHRLPTHRLLVAATFVGIDDDHPHALDPRRDFLCPGARRFGLLPRRDPNRAIDPLGFVDGGQPAAQPPVATSLEADQVAMATIGDYFKIILSDHTSITDEDQGVESES